jgi:hypothetical protein
MGRRNYLVRPGEDEASACLLSHRRLKFLDVSRRELRARKAARSAETICVTAGEILRAFTPTECAANHFRNSGYAESIML